MHTYTKIALITLFVTNFTLFLGWVPIGVMIPQTLFILATFLVQLRLFVSKSLLLCLLFFIYQVAISSLYDNGLDITGLVSRFYGMAIPVLVSTFLFNPKYLRDCRWVSKFVLIVSFITMLLSIRVLLFDGAALRMTSMANSTGDWSTLYRYWRQGMADYAMAAMMMFMPVVLVYYYKNSNKRREKNLLIFGIAIVIVFMYLGQVTTTFVMCLLVTLLSVFRSKNVAYTYIGIALLIVFLVTQFSGLLDLAVLFTGDSAMNERFISVSDAISGEELDEASDAGIRIVLLKLSLNAFLSNPLFGNPTALIGGHNYFLDCLAKFGIIGCLPLFILLWHQFKMISHRLSDVAKQYYALIFIVFIVYGISKNLSGTEYWNYLLIYYPALFVWIDSKTKASFV